MIDEDNAWYWFVNINGIGRKTRNYLLDIFGSPAELYDAGDNVIKSIDGINDAGKNALMESRRKYVPDDYAKLSDKEIVFVNMNSRMYPDRLANIPDKPHALYMRGKSYDKEEILNMPSVSVVGSRKCSRHGYETAYKIGRGLALNGIAVVSGMARGIDSASHRGCIEAGGRPVAVLGCGVDVCYPKENIGLYMDIMKSGLVLSEYPAGASPRPGTFPERNRIISGLGDVLVVVEAGERSGTFITVDMALEQGKDVYAVPGRISDEQSLGCNGLIKQGAHIFTGTEEVVDYVSRIQGFKMCGQKQVPDGRNNIPLSLSEDELMVYGMFDMLPKHIDEIADVTGMDIGKVIRIIGKLESYNIIKHTCNNYYVRRGAE